MGIAEIFPLLREYGNSSTAYHSLQPGLEHFVVSGIGYVPFRRVRKPNGKRDVILVSGNPIASTDNLRPLLSEFLDQYPSATFFQVDQQAAEALNELGHYVNEFGIETMLHLPYHLKGGKRADIRLLCNRARASGVQVYELSSENRMRYGIRDEDIARLSAAWIRSQPVSSAEFSFLSRPFQYRDEPDCRKFYAVHEGRLAGLTVFDPIYRAGKIIGYAEVISRANRNAPKGTRDFLLVTAMQQMANEGIRFVSLGLSPLADVTEMDPAMSHLKRSRFVGWCFDFLYRRLDGVVFNFQGLHFKKGRYAKELLPGEGTIEKRYCAFDTKFPMIALYHAYAQTAVSPARPLIRKPLRALSGAFHAAEELLAHPGLYLS